MKLLFKKILFILIKPIYLYMNNIIIRGKCQLSYNLFKEKNIKGTKGYPVLIKNSTIVHATVLEGCKIFDSVCIGKVNIGRFVTLAGPGIKICGNINGIEIGSFTSIAANVVIQEGEHDYSRFTTYFINKNVLKNNVNEQISKGKIIIEEDVWIGSNCVILSGVTIGRGAVIGAGSVVTKNIPAYSINVGIPAKVIKMRFDNQKIKEIEKTEWWKWDVTKIQTNSKLFLTENITDFFK